jgi:hypothetical protein
MYKTLLAIPFLLFLLTFSPSDGAAFGQSSDRKDSDSAAERHSADALLPRPHRKTADKKFWVLAGLQVAATFADFETTQWAQGKAPRGAELNPLFGSHPGRARMYSIGLTLTGAQIYAQFRSKKLAERRGRFRKAWIVGGLLDTGVHTFLAVHNAQIAAK